MLLCLHVVFRDCFIWHKLDAGNLRNENATPASHWQTIE